MMKTFDQFVEINHNPNLPFITDYPYRILIIGSSKTRFIELNKTSMSRYS